MKRYVLFLLFGITAALFLNETTHFFLFPAALLALALIDRRAYRIFKRWKLWLVFVFLILIPVLLISPKEAEWLGVPYNSKMLLLNLIMVERSIVIMLTIKLFTNHIALESISRGLIRLRLVQFEQVFRLAMAMLPQVRATASQTCQDSNWRALMRRPSGLLHLLGGLVARIIFQARRHGTSPLQKEESKS